jgi:nucleolar complex protein 3
MEPPSKEPENLKKKGKKKDFINKKKKKLMREEKELQRDLKEAEAEYSKEEKQRLHTQTLKIVFHIFFRVLKNMVNGPLLGSVLRGLGK